MRIKVSIQIWNDEQEDWILTELYFDSFNQTRQCGTKGGHDIIVSLSRT